jgi:hypothetical protein
MDGHDVDAVRREDLVSARDSRLSLPGAIARVCVYFEEEDARPRDAQGFSSTVTEPTSVTRYV